MSVTTTRFDVALDALSHVYRRRLLVELLSVSELSLRDDENVVANGGDVDPDVVYQQLFHLHLPKLVGLGFVEWDRTTDVVGPGARFEEIAPLLGLIAANATDLPDGWL